MEVIDADNARPDSPTDDVLSRPLTLPNHGTDTEWHTDHCPTSGCLFPAGHSGPCDVRACSLQDTDPREARAAGRRVKVEQIMTRDVLVAEPHTRLLDAAVSMREHKISCLPVVEDRILVGLLTETDLVDVLIDALQSPGSPDAASPQRG